MISSRSPSALPRTETIPDPTSFSGWLNDNGQLLQPPVNNFCLLKGNDFILMVVGGPNQRNDFHVNETEVTISSILAPFDIPALR